MQTFKEFIAEAGEFKDVHHDLLKAGMERHYGMGHRSANSDYYERNYSANHTPEQVHEILMKHGFKPVTHYRRGGGRMPIPYTNYEDDRAGGTSFTLHHKDGKVHYVHWNGRQSHN